MSPQISIGMAVYNSAATLPACLRSLMQQTYENWELIILDDGSTDDTAELAKEFRDERIRWSLAKENRGLAWRLNEAVAMARGNYFARMDADDIAYPHRLQTQLEYLQRHPHVDLVASEVLVFRGEGEAVGSMHFAEDHASICRRPGSSLNGLPHPTWLGRHAWFGRFPYRTQFRKAQDRDLLLRAFRSSRFACVPEILLGYRQEQLSLKKILATRRYVCQALAEQTRAHLDARMALGVIQECLKGCVDIAAVASRLHYRLLRHRAVPLSPVVINQWHTVWRQCHAAVHRSAA